MRQIKESDDKHLKMKLNYIHVQNGRDDNDNSRA